MKAAGMSDGLKKVGANFANRFSPQAIDRALKASTSNARTEVFKRVFAQDGATLPDGSKTPKYSEAYLERRQQLYGRNNANINFIATGSLSVAYAFERKNARLYVLGFNEVGNKTEVSNANKYKYLSDRFGAFVQLNGKEIANWYKVFAAELIKSIPK